MDKEYYYSGQNTIMFSKSLIMENERRSMGLSTIRLQDDV